MSFFAWILLGLFGRIYRHQDRESERIRIRTRHSARCRGRRPRRMAFQRSSASVA